MRFFSKFIVATLMQAGAVGSALAASGDGKTVPQDGVWTEEINGVKWTYKITDGIASMGGGRAGNLSYYPAVDTKTTGDLVVPNAVYLSSCPVREIGDSAFRNCSKIESVTIPEGVTRIGCDAFSGCYSIQSITFPESLKDIDEDAVCSCRKLAHIVIPSGVTNIGENAFARSDSLTEIRIPVSVIRIGDYAFRGCGGLERIEVSADNPCYASVDGVLYDKGCTRLIWCPGKKPSVRIPATVTQVPYYVFSENCYGLNESLEKIEVEDGNPVFAALDGVLYDKTFTKLVCCPSQKESLKIPQSVTVIGNSAFSGCANLTKVDLPSGVTEIGANAFTDCFNLKSVRIPAGVTEIGNSVFCECIALEEIVGASHVTSIGASAFYGCEKLSFSIPEGVTNIGIWAFQYCHNLRSVTIPSGVKNLGDEMFVYSWGLEKVMIQCGVESIGRSVFSGCSDLKSVMIPSTVVKIGNSALSGCDGLTSIYVDVGDVTRVKGMLEASGTDTSSLMFYEVSVPCVFGDPDAVVTGDEISGFVVRASEGVDDVMVSIPTGTDANNVTVEVPTTAKRVVANGASVKIVKICGERRYDITKCLTMPLTVRGTLDVSQLAVRQEYADQALDFAHGARFDPNAEVPITTAETVPGLTYVLQEGRTLEAMSDGDAKVGDGGAWQPRASVRGGTSGFYRIKVTK